MKILSSIDFITKFKNKLSLCREFYKSSLLVSSVSASTMSAKSGPSTIYEFTAKDIDGNELQALYDEFGSTHGLKILGFPCNQFGGQEPWPEAEIKKYLTEKFGVTFDMFSKIDVNGSNTHPLFKFLKDTQGGTFGNFIKWNFTKFLIDKDGKPVERYSPTTEPFDIKKDLPKYW